MELDKFDPEIDDMVMGYLYSGKIKLTKETAVNVFKMANLLKIEKLRSICIAFVREKLSLKNCLQYWELADVDPECEFRTYVQTYICKSLNDVMNRADFLELEMKQILRLLGGIKVTQSELPNRAELIHSALMKWISHNVPKRLPHIGYLLRLVKPQEMSDEYFNTVLLENEFMKNNTDASNWVSGVMLGRPPTRWWHRL